LEAWRASVDLARNVYELTKQYPKGELFGLISQMRRASVSIASNIAEGAARNGDKELLQFLYIALGSAGEVLIYRFFAREAAKDAKENPDESNRKNFANFAFSREIRISGT